MSLVAPVKDGNVVETESQTSLKKANASNNNSMDKEAFLQLLVAQMQYQDPLEPTSNTEFISQYAQFSQVEQMQNMAATTELARASSLVGEQVYVKTVGSNGDSNYVFGKVDYVVFEGGKAYLSIEESLYSLDDLDTVVDPVYKAAYDKAYDFNIELNKLPSINGIDLSNAEKIDELEEIYNNMTDYEKSFVASDNVTALKKYIEKLKEVREAAGITDETDEPDETDKADGTDKSDESDKTDDTDKADGTDEADGGKEEGATDGAEKA